MAAAVTGGGDLFLSGRERRIDVRSIEKDLVGLWNEAAQGGGAVSVTRAAIATLAIIAGDGRAAAHMTELIGTFTRRVPCRALLIRRAPRDVDPPITACASAHCHRTGTGAIACSEQVTITVSPTAVRHVPALVTPLLLPDLPAFVYWPDALALVHPGSFPELLEAFFGQVEYIVVDSARARDPMIAMALLADLLERPGPGRPHPRDLNWSRLLTWREAIADLFEPPERRSWAAAITGITIRASRGEDREGCLPSRPVLLAAWLKQRLGWTRTGVETANGTFRIVCAGGRGIDIELDGDDDGPRGRLASVTCRCGGDHRVTLLRDHDDALAVRIEDQGRRREERLPRQADTEETLLGGEIQRREPDHVYEAAVIEAADLVRASFHGAARS